MSSYKLIATYKKDPMDEIYNISSDDNIIQERIGLNIFNTHDYSINYSWNSLNENIIKSHIVETEGIVSPITFRNTINSLIKKGIGEILIRNVSSKLKKAEVSKLVRKNSDLLRGVTIIKDNDNNINNRIKVERNLGIKTISLANNDTRIKNNLSIAMGGVNTTINVNTKNGLYFISSDNLDNISIKNLYNLNSNVDRIRNNANNKEFILDNYSPNKVYYVVLKYNNLLNNNVFKGDVFTTTTPIKLVINGRVRYRNLDINTSLNNKILTLTVDKFNNNFDINNNIPINDNTFNYYIHEVISI